MKQHIDSKQAWRHSIRRYQIASIIGLVLCVSFFWMLYRLPVDAIPPLWMFWGTGFSGLLFFGGVFGMAMSYFLRALHK